MKCILIDPWARTVTESEVSGHGDSRDGLPGLYEALSAPSHKVDTFAVLILSPRVTLYLDDEGLLSPGVPLWRLDGYPEPLAGRALILGTDDEGDASPCPIPLAAVAPRVAWTDAETSG